MTPVNATDALLDAVRALPDGRLLVAVSGGPDSIALLLALHAAGRDLCVGHVNHGLRGEESQRDESFVRELSNRLSVPFLVRNIDTHAHASTQRLSLETAARDLRYQALESMRGECAADYIALGHTRDDQAETVLMHLLRGAGPTGLSGMPLQRDAIVRPFLNVPRATILQAL